MRRGISECRCLHDFSKNQQIPPAKVCKQLICIPFTFYLSLGNSIVISSEMYVDALFGKSVAHALTCWQFQWRIFVVLPDKHGVPEKLCVKRRSVRLI